MVIIEKQALRNKENGKKICIKRRIGGPIYEYTDGRSRLCFQDEQTWIANVKSTFEEKSSIATKGTIKLMSYNLWSSNFKLPERMDAIGKLIDKETPDAVFLQEVTPVIYKMLQKCSWWGRYTCSVPPEKAKKKFFCMLLSTLPVKESFFKPFKSSTEGKGISVSYVEVEDNRRLVISTSHLKRPTVSDTNHNQRLAQAKEACNFLHCQPNVIFGGDMNWDDDSDGAFPLPKGWHDPWSTLRPSDYGWTYDTNSNNMLRYHRPLQKRLDRFFCKLRDFEAVKIRLVGTEAIPHQDYICRGRTLPVLPSDHYGLILSIRPKVPN